MNPKYTFFYGLLGLLSLIAIACSDNEPSPNTEEKSKFIKAVTPDFVPTRIESGDVPNSVYWQEEDLVVVNGLRSSFINIDNIDPTMAEFAFNVALPTPYCAISPHSACNSYSSENQTATIALPDVQYSTKGDFDPDAAVMLAYSEKAGDMTFEHAMSFLKIKVNAVNTTDNIKQIVLTTNGGEALSGKFKASFSADGCEIQKGNEYGSTLTVNCRGTGIALGNSVLVAIPPQYYSGFTLTITDDASEFMKTNLKDLSLHAEKGKVTTLNIDFEPGAFSGEIESPQDWNLFAAKAAKGYSFEGETVELKADISTDNLDMVSGFFKGIFKGNGHSITQTANNKPLFETIGEQAEVSGLTAKGSFTSFSNAAMYGNAVVAAVNLGSIKDITVDCPLTLTSYGDVIVGCIVAQNGGLIKDCTNSSDINLTVHASQKVLTCCGGGISAYGHTISGINASTGIPNIDGTCRAGKFINCTNNGTVSVAVTGDNVDMDKDKGSVVGLSSYGGICGLVMMDGVAFENCTNTGAISRKSVSESSCAGSTSIGGILGSCNGYFTDWQDHGASICINTGTGYQLSLVNCKNSGEILSNCRHSSGIKNSESGVRIDYAGGIIGAAFGKDASNEVSISSCQNTGKVCGGWSSGVNTQSLGGIAGGARYAHIKQCEVECELGNIKNNAAIGAAGGYVAFAKEGVKVTESSKSYITFGLHIPNADLACLWGLAFGNIVTSASIADSQTGATGYVGTATLDLTEANFATYLSNKDSKSKPTVSNVTLWKK